MIPQNMTAEFTFIFAYCYNCFKLINFNKKSYHAQGLGQPQKIVTTEAMTTGQFLMQPVILASVVSPNGCTSPPATKLASLFCC